MSPLGLLVICASELFLIRRRDQTFHENAAFDFDRGWVRRKKDDAAGVIRRAARRRYANAV